MLVDWRGGVTRRRSRLPKLLSFGAIAIRVEWLLFNLEWWRNGWSGSKRTETSLAPLSRSDGIQSSVEIVEADDLVFVIRVGGGYFVLIYLYE